MKSGKKKRFDIKALLIAHVEKILLVLIVPLAGYIAYQGLLYEPLRWQPGDLQQIAEAANSHIKANERKAADEGVSIFTYDTYAEWIKREIKPDLYRTEIQWLPSLFPEKNKRGEVPLFPVTDLRARSGLGAVSINPSSPLAAGLTTPFVGRRWAVVTGLLPIKKQLDEYVNAYSSSIHPDPMRDMPMYVFYEVQRAEITPGQSAETLDWQKLDFYPEFNKAGNLWSTVATDPVDPNFLAPMSPGAIPMAYPLPPTDKPYGEEVAHPPAIPVLTETQMKEMKQMEKLQEKMIKEMFDVSESDVLHFDPFTGTQTAAARKDRKKQEEEEVPTVSVTDYLFRFFDFDVQPGKTYRYRVRVYLMNPNYKLGENFLLDAALAANLHLVTDFSDPSNMVTVPLESRILATNVIAPSVRAPWTDPTASIMAVHFDIADGSQWCVDLERVYRGSTINYPRREATNYAMATQTASMMEGGEAPPPRTPPRSRNPRDRRTPPKEEPKANVKTVDVVSDVCVLDMLGGASLLRTAMDAPELRAPGKIMVLEPSGNLVIRQVPDDQIEVEHLKHPKGALGGGMMEEGYGGGMNSMGP